MQCPTDGAVLTMSERSGIEIDYCPTCRGVWLDRGELDKIIERSLTQPTGRPGPAAAAAALPAAVPAARTAPARYGQQGYGKPYKKRKESWLSESSTGARARRRRSAMEYVEIARAESERGELVLRERRHEDGPTLARAAGQRRLRDGHPRDQHRAGPGRRGAGAGRRPAGRLVGGLGLGFTMHEVLADSRVERCSVVEIEQALVDWMRDGTIPHGPAAARRRARQRRGRRRRRGAGRGRARRRTTWSCWTSTTARATSSTTPTPRSTSRPSSSRRAAALRPGGALVVWSADEAPELEAALQRGLRQRRGPVARGEAPGAGRALLALRRAGTVARHERR